VNRLDLDEDIMTIAHTTLHASLLTAALALAVGCSDTRDEAKFASAPAHLAADATPQGGERTEEDAREDAGRMVIRTASMTVRVDQPEAHAAQVLALAKEVGGFVVDSSSNGGEGWESVGATLRVPASQFDATLARLRGLGTVTHEQIHGQDVTDEYVDLGARVANQRRLEQRLLALMDGATSVKDALEVEKELARVRGEIERAEGRRKGIEDRVSLSTITVTLSSTAREPGFGDELWEAVSDGGEGARRVSLGLLQLGIAVSPLLALGGLCVGVGVGAARRRRRRRDSSAD
jgi:hypothetical protein